MWKSPFIVVPPAGVEIWIRVNWFYGVSVLATYNNETQMFICSDTLIELPVYIVARWRLQSVLVGLPIGEGMIGSSFMVG